jgi:hypothetical protein
MPRIDSLDLSLIDNLPTDSSSHCLYEDRLATKPSYSQIEQFKEVDASLDCGASYIRKNGAIRDRHDLNWCSVDDFTDNWRLLTKDEQNVLYSLVTSETKTNACRYGLKRKNLETHLLLNLGCDMTNIVDNHADSVLTNLKRNGYYPRACLSNRTVDPRTSLRYIWKFNRTHSVETLFAKKFVCFTCVVSSDDSYRKIVDMESAKTRYHSFFRENVDYVRSLSKKGKVLSYIYSNEISVDSIINQKYRPHTHFMFFVQKNEANREGMLEIERDFNQRFGDRVMEFTKTCVDLRLLPTEIRKASEGKKLSDYMFKTYSLAPLYMREIREDNIRELNLKTVETYRNLIWLYRGEDANRKKGVRRNQHSHIPSVDEVLSFKHPLLQNKRKYPTIKKSSPNTGKNETSETRPSKPLPAGGISKTRRTHGSRKSAAGKPAEGSKLQRGSLPSRSTETINAIHKPSRKASENSIDVRLSKQSSSRASTSPRTGKDLRRGDSSIISRRECSDAAADQKNEHYPNSDSAVPSNDRCWTRGLHIRRKIDISSGRRRSILREGFSASSADKPKQCVASQQAKGPLHSAKPEREASAKPAAGSSTNRGGRQ